MAATMVGPPPAADVQQQRGPFSMASQQQQQAPPQQQGGPGDQGTPTQPLEGQLIMVTIQMRHMLQAPDGDPSLAPWVNSAITSLQAGVRQVLAQKRQSSGGGMPLESSTPSSEPGAGLPF